MKKLIAIIVSIIIVSVAAYVSVAGANVYKSTVTGTIDNGTEVQIGFIFSDTDTAFTILYDNGDTKIVNGDGDHSCGDTIVSPESDLVVGLMGMDKIDRLPYKFFAFDTSKNRLEFTGVADHYEYEFCDGLGGKITIYLNGNEKTFVVYNMKFDTNLMVEE